jgi:hypothetical protein
MIAWSLWDPSAHVPTPDRKDRSWGLPGVGRTPVCQGFWTRCGNSNGQNEKCHLFSTGFRIAGWSPINNNNSEFKCHMMII